jgi:hypothetical protein
MLVRSFFLIIAGDQKSAYGEKMSSEPNSHAKSGKLDLIKALSIAFLATLAIFYLVVRDSESHSFIFKAALAVWAWATVFGVIAFIPFYQKYRSQNFPKKKGWLAEFDHSATCYVSGFLLILFGCATAAFLEALTAKLPDGSDFAVLVTAVAGGALCSDAILGVTDRAGGHEAHFRPNLLLACSVFAWLSLALAMILYCEIKHSTDTFIFSLLFMIFCIITNFLLVHILNPDVEIISNKADPLFFRGFALIVIGAAFSYAYTKLDTDLESSIHVFAKYFFVSYTSAIGAVMVARSFEWNA